MQSMLCDSFLVQIATHEQRQSLTQFFGDLEISTHRVKASTLICYFPVACVALKAYVQFSLSMCSYG